MTKKTLRYGVIDFELDFPNEKSCLEVLFAIRYAYECLCGGKFSPLFKLNKKKQLCGRRQYQCSKCRHQIAPTANTPFHKSSTPLRLWFLAIFYFSNAKTKYSAKQIERNLGVTYKTAWRILNIIRKSIKQDSGKTSKIINTKSIIEEMISRG